MQKRACSFRRGEKTFAVIFDVDNAWRAAEGVRRLLENPELEFTSGDAFELVATILHFSPRPSPNEPAPPPVIGK
jgi:hypothetical protein